jgi:hypothetical protein
LLTFNPAILPLKAIIAPTFEPFLPMDKSRGFLAHFDEHGYLAAGRKWGVSDNAIRKWLRRGIQ